VEGYGCSRRFEVLGNCSGYSGELGITVIMADDGYVKAGLVIVIRAS